MKTINKSSLLAGALSVLAIVFSAHLQAKAQTQYVVLYENEHYSGSFTSYSVGEWDLDGKPFDNKASSMTVPDGYIAYVCNLHYKNPARFFGCDFFPEGKYRFNELNKKVSYLLVRIDKGVRDNCIVCLYSGFNETGYTKRYTTVGNFSLNETTSDYSVIDGNRSPLLSETTSSMWIAPGYTVTIKGDFDPETFPPGIVNLAPYYNNQISKITIRKGLKLPDTKSPTPNTKIIPLSPKIKTKPFPKTIPKPSMRTHEKN